MTKYQRAFEEIARRFVRDERVFDFIEKVLSLETIAKTTLTRVEHRRGGGDVGPDQYFIEMGGVVSSPKDYENLRRFLRKVLPQFRPDSIEDNVEQKQAKFRLHDPSVDEIARKFGNGGDVDHSKGMEATYATRIYATLSVRPQ